ncbi:MAG: hypothetical protein R2715_05940 [Ilumatobacteraceae bacterium]
MAPEAIVTAVAAKTAWKKKVVASLKPPAGIVAVLAGEEEAARSDQLAGAAEGEGVAGGEPGGDAEHRVHHVLGEDVDRVLGPGEPGLDEERIPPA